jgi:PAS domain S-box-containing protein
MKVWLGVSPGPVLMPGTGWLERSSAGETNTMELEAKRAECDDEKGLDRAIAGSLNLPFETIAPESVTPLIYQQIFKAMREGLWMIDACGVTTYVNDQMAGILGYSVNEMIGRPFFEFMEPSSHADAVVLFERRCEGISESHEFQFLTKLGEPRWTAMVCSSFSDPSGQFQGAVATVYDISEKRREELVHRENEQSLRMLLEKLPVTAWSMDQNYRILSSYGAGLKNLGLENNQLAGTSLFEFAQGLDPEIGNLLLSEHKKALAGQSVQFETQALGRFIYNILEPVLGRSGEPVGMIGISVDLTERNESQKRLQESEARQRAILNTAIDAILSVDEAGAIISANKASENLFDYSQAELTGKFIHEMVVSNLNIFNRPESQVSIAVFDDHENEKSDVEMSGPTKRIRDTGGADRLWFALKRDGSMIPVEISKGQIDGIPMKTMVIRDVSGIRELQRQLVSITEDQERRIGQELHDDIGQEMTGATMLTEALISDLKRLDAGAEVLGLAERIHTRLVRSRGVVRKLARGLALELIDADGLCHELEELATSIRALHSLDCVWDPPERSLNIDPEMATQLFRIAQEAVNNALKHSRASVIEIAMTGKASLKTWELRIADNGKGFAQTATNGAVGGMGLRIMQYRAKLIGGVIEIQVPDEGGTIVVCKFQEQNFHE